MHSWKKDRQVSGECSEGEEKAMKQISEEYRARAQKLIKNVGLCADLKMKLTSLRPGDMIGEIDLKQKHLNFHGNAHGGTIFALADTISGYAVSSLGRNCTTINANINYLRAFHEKDKIICHAKVTKIGQTCAWVRAELQNEDGVLCGTADYVYYLLEELNL